MSLASCHTLRSTIVSQLHAEAMPLAEIADQTGHRDLRVLEELDIARAPSSPVAAALRDVAAGRDDVARSGDCTGDRLARRVGRARLCRSGAISRSGGPRGARTHNLRIKSRLGWGREWLVRDATVALTWGEARDGSHRSGPVLGELRTRAWETADPPPASTLNRG